MERNKSLATIIIPIILFIAALIYWCFCVVETRQNKIKVDKLTSEITELQYKSNSLDMLYKEVALKQIEASASTAKLYDTTLVKDVNELSGAELVFANGYTERYESAKKIIARIDARVPVVELVGEKQEIAVKQCGCFDILDYGYRYAAVVGESIDGTKHFLVLESKYNNESVTVTPIVFTNNGSDAIWEAKTLVEVQKPFEEWQTFAYSKTTMTKEWWDSRPYASETEYADDAAYCEEEFLKEDRLVTEMSPVFSLDGKLCMLNGNVLYFREDVNDHFKVAVFSDDIDCIEMPYWWHPETRDDDFIYKYEYNDGDMTVVH